MANDLTAPPQSPLALILADPAQLAAIPIDTVERLFAIDREIKADASRKEFSIAFHALQGDLAPVHKAAKNTHTKSWYATLEDVEAMLDPLLQRHGFSVSLSSQPGAPADHSRFVLIVRHNGGHTEEHIWDAPIDDKGIKGEANKTRLHGGASARTYAKRYLKVDVFDVSTYRDDDGNAAGAGPGAEAITQEQFQQLNDLADESGADKVRLAAWLQSSFGIDALAKLPARHFDRVRLMLEDRAKKAQADLERERDQ